LNGVFKPFSIYTDNGAFQYEPASLLATSIYSNVSKDAINVFFVPYLTPTTSPFIGGASVSGSDITYHYFCGSPAYTGGDFGGPLLAHELAHVIGKFPDHYTTNTVVPSIIPIASPSVPIVLSLPGNGPFYAEDAAYDIVQSYSCFNPSDPTYPVRNNNLMGNSFCRSHLSAQQIAAIHMLVALGYTNRFTQFKNTPYPSPITSPTLTFSGTQTITTNQLFQNIIIPSGSSITVQNANLLGVSPYSKIIIEAGASLEMTNSTASSYLGSIWEGIELRGNSFLPQNSLNQGRLKLTNSCVNNARIGITVGQKNSSGNLTGVNGGGILEATNSIFFNNITHLNFDYLSGVSVASNNSQNLSILRQCTFENTVKYMDTVKSMNMILLNNTRKLRILSCKFINTNSSITTTLAIAIKGNNSSIELRPDIGVPSNISSSNLDYIVYLTNCFGNNLIQDNVLNAANAIYISNGNYDKIVRNSIDIFSNNNFTASDDRVAIYLDNCKNYKVEENKMFAFQPYRSYGIIVNNSGPYPNKIYNNSFLNMYLGIWCQNQNYDPNSSTYDGLVLNCNDFNNINYCVGVQDNNPFNNTGIAKFQGDPTNPLLGVRNTYNVPSCGNENKFYVYAPSDNPPLIEHYSFQNPQFRVIPQPSCSNLNEIIDITSIVAPPNRSVFCVSTSTLPAVRNFHTGQISLLQTSINSIESIFNSNLDNGNTQNLLTLINSNASAGQIKNQLLAAPYLSDTVLISYFQKTSTPPGHAKQVHEKNAPVVTKVWQVILNQNYPNGIFNQMVNKQNTIATSPRNVLLGQKSIIRNDLNYEIMHKGMSLLNDSILGVISKRDSLKQLIQLGLTRNQSQQLIELDMSLGLYEQAREKITQLINNPLNLDDLLYANFMLSYLNLLRQPEKMNSFNPTLPEYAIINEVALTVNHPCNLFAKGLFSFLNNTNYPLLYLSPLNDASGRLSSISNSNNSTDSKSHGDNFEIFPNPASSKLYFKTNVANSTKLIFYNLIGKMVLNKALEGKDLEEIDITNLPIGIYLVSLISDSGDIIKSQKLIIEH
jgi:hypothetical protein